MCGFSDNAQRYLNDIYEYSDVMKSLCDINKIFDIIEKYFNDEEIHEVNNFMRISEIENIIEEYSKQEYLAEYFNYIHEYNT